MAEYRAAWLRGDIIAGVTLAAYAIPDSLAYAGDLPAWLRRLAFMVPDLPIPVGEQRRIRISAADVRLCLTPPRASTILNVLPA